MKNDTIHNIQLKIYSLEHTLRADMKVNELLEWLQTAKDQIEDNFMKWCVENFSKYHFNSPTDLYGWLVDNNSTNPEDYIRNHED